MLRKVIDDLKVLLAVLGALTSVQGQIVNALHTLNVADNVSGDVFVVIGGITVLAAAFLQVAENVSGTTKAQG